MKNIYTTVLIGSALLLGGTAMAQSAGKTGHSHPEGFRTLHVVSGTISQRGGGAPANDDCSGATVHALTTGSNVVVNGDNTGATDAEGYGFASVWEAFTTTTCANVTVELCGTTPAFLNYVTGLGDCPTSAVTQATVVDTCDDGNVTSFYLGLPAGTYYIPVLMSDVAPLAVGPYTMTITAEECAAAPLNDECAGAVNLTQGTACTPTAGTTAGATQSIDPILCNGFTSPNANDVWYSFTATSANDTITVEGIDTFDGVIELFSGDCGTLTSLGCEDGNFPQGAPATERMYVSGLTVGSIYYFRVYDYGNASLGMFNVCVVDADAPPPAPANDECAGAEMLTPATTCNSVAGTSADATQSMAPVLCNGFTSPDAIDVWYSFTTTTASDSIIVEGLDTFDAVIEFFSGDCGTLTSLGCEDSNFPQGAPVTERMFVSGLTAGSTYYFRVYDYANASTDHMFNVCVMSDMTIGVNEVAASTFSLYPNPTQGDITISGAELNGTVNFELTDMTGRVVYKDQKTMISGQSVTLPLNGKLAQGTYSLRVITANSISSRAVMIK